MQTLLEGLPTATEAPIWAEPNQSRVLLSPGKPTEGREWGQGSIGENTKAFGVSNGT